MLPQHQLHVAEAFIRCREAYYGLGTELACIRGMLISRQRFTLPFRPAQEKAAMD